MVNLDEVMVNLNEGFRLTNSDTFHYRTKLDDKTEKVTKRIILASTAQIHDPLGLLRPVVIKAKL